MSSFSPGLVAIALALLIPLFRGRARQVFLLLIPILSYGYLLWLRQHLDGGVVTAAFMGYELMPVYLDSLSFVFGTVFHLALLIGLIFAWHVDDPVQQVAACVYAGSTIGAVFAGDLITLFVYWEIVALASTFLIWARRTESSYRSGQRYLIWQILSGVILLAGILTLAQSGHDLNFRGKLGLELGTGAKLIFVAFGIKCAWPGLHTWLVDAYPEATPTGSVFLSAFTSKLAVFALARCFPGEPLLIVIGAIMAFFPIFLAEIENDLRKVLSYSLINQVGFMVVAVGIGTNLAINGAAAHAFADVLFKGLLFMTMGAVLHKTGTVKASDLGGLYKTMPFTTLCCLVGALSISAFPLFSAFATKSLIMDAAAKNAHPAVWFVLLFAAAGVLFHAGIKIPYFAFFAHDSGKRPGPPPLNMRIAMGIGAFGCIALGCYPQALYALLPYPIDYQPYTAYHVVGQLQLLLFSTLACVILMRRGLYPEEVRGINLDVDWVWRRPLLSSWRLLQSGLAELGKGFQMLVLETLPKQSAAFVQRYGFERGWFRERGIMGSSILVVLVLLVVFLLFGLVYGHGRA